MSRRLVYRAVYIPSLLAIAGMVVVFAHPIRSRAAFKPKEMATFVAEDKSFLIQYPRAWQKSVSNLNGTGTRAHFQRDTNSEIVVTCDLAGSLMLDMAKLNTPPSGMSGADTSTAGGTPLPPMGGAGASGTGMSGAGGVSGLEGLPGMGGIVAKSPVEAAHLAGAGYMRGKFRHYAPTPGVRSQMAGGEMMVSAFTARTADFINTQDIVGRHATVLVGNKPVSVDAYCVKGQDEDDLFRAFEAMLPTLRVNETGG